MSCLHIAPQRRLRDLTVPKVTLCPLISHSLSLFLFYSPKPPNTLHSSVLLVSSITIQPTLGSLDIVFCDQASPHLSFTEALYASGPLDLSWGCASLELKAVRLPRVNTIPPGRFGFDSANFLFPQNHTILAHHFSNITTRLVQPLELSFYASCTTTSPSWIATNSKSNSPTSTLPLTSAPRKSLQSATGQYSLLQKKNTRRYSGITFQKVKNGVGIGDKRQVRQWPCREGINVDEAKVHYPYMELFALR